VPFPILFGTTVTTVLHYRADCDNTTITRLLGAILGSSRSYTTIIYIISYTGGAIEPEFGET